MATLARAEIIDRALQRINVLAQGQNASPGDGILVGQMLDSVHKQLQGPELAPWPVTAVPEGAQEGFIECVASAAMPFFGKGEGVGLRREGEKKLTADLGVKKENPVRAPQF